MDNTAQNCGLDRENQAIETMIELETLFVKKAKIYSRILTDMALAEMMEELGAERERTALGFVALLTGEEDEKSGLDKGDLEE